MASSRLGEKCKVDFEKIVEKIAQLLRIAPSKRSQFLEGEIVPLYTAAHETSDQFINLATSTRLDLLELKRVAETPTNDHTVLNQRLDSLTRGLDASLSKGRAERINAWSTAGVLRDSGLFSNDFFVVLSKDQQSSIVAFSDAVVAYFGGKQSYSHDLRSMADSLARTQSKFKDGADLPILQAEIESYISDTRRVEEITKLRWQNVSEAFARLQYSMKAP